MKRKIDITGILKRFPTLVPLDVHFYGLKSHGIDYDEPEKGRPKLHILDEKSLFSVVPLLVDLDSPYVLRGEELRFQGEPLPVKVKYFKRSNDPYYSYFYFRSKDKWIQTLDDEISLNLNFNPNCSGCSFCTRVNNSGLDNLSVKEGMKKLAEAEVDLSKVNELAIVTGMFRNEEATIQHISEIAELAPKQGFVGKLFYLGSQIKSKEGIKRLADTVNLNSFRYAYTLESFTNRKFNHKKQETLEEAIANLITLRSSGIDKLEYTYIPGMDNFSDFEANTPQMVTIARPHLSIFRPAEESQRNLPCKDFKEIPVEYLANMRLFLENLYGGPILGNNLANLWSFPLNRLNNIFSTDKTNSLG